MSPLEIAIYVLVLTSGRDVFTCTGMDGAVACTNGYAAAYNGAGEIEFQNGVTLQKRQDGTVAFTNGIDSHWASVGWVQFSNGLSVRRERDGRFRFSNGVVCAPDARDGQGRDRAACRKP